MNVFFCFFNVGVLELKKKKKKKKSKGDGIEMGVAIWKAASFITFQSLLFVISSWLGSAFRHSRVSACTNWAYAGWLMTDFTHRLGSHVPIYVCMCALWTHVCTRTHTLHWSIPSERTETLLYISTHTHTVCYTSSSLYLSTHFFPCPPTVHCHTHTHTHTHKYIHNSTSGP